MKDKNPTSNPTSNPALNPTLGVVEIMGLKVLQALARRGLPIIQYPSIQLLPPNNIPFH